MYDDSLRNIHTRDLGLSEHWSTHPACVLNKLAVSCTHSLFGEGCCLASCYLCLLIAVCVAVTYCILFTLGSDSPGCWCQLPASPPAAFLNLYQILAAGLFRHRYATEAVTGAYSYCWRACFGICNLIVQHDT